MKSASAERSSYLVTRVSPAPNPRLKTCPDAANVRRCRHPWIDWYRYIRYGGAVRSAVHALKYRNITAIAPVIAALISQHPYSRNARIDCVAPVPIHTERLRERGYNQAALLAEHVAESRKLLFIPEALSKTRATASQVDLTKQERATSLRGAFAANFDFDDAHVLLIDDVCTTGNTLMNCAAALKRAGARRVSAMVFAKETIDNEAQF